MLILAGQSLRLNLWVIFSFLLLSSLAVLSSHSHISDGLEWSDLISMPYVIFQKSRGLHSTPVKSPQINKTRSCSKHSGWSFYIPALLLFLLSLLSPSFPGWTPLPLLPKAGSLGWAWRADITLPPVSVGWGRGERERGGGDGKSSSSGGGFLHTAGRGSF